jgi:hypothetical protein
LFDPKFNALSKPLADFAQPDCWAFAVSVDKKNSPVAVTVPSDRCHVVFPFYWLEANATPNAHRERLDSLAIDHAHHAQTGIKVIAKCRLLG